MTADPTLATLREQHRPESVYDGFDDPVPGQFVCHADGKPWPCDAAAATHDAQEYRALMADVREHAKRTGMTVNIVEYAAARQQGARKERERLRQTVMDIIRRPSMEGDISPVTVERLHDALAEPPADEVSEPNGGWTTDAKGTRWLP